MAFIDGQGTTTQIHDYQYRISDVMPGRHRFRLKQVDLDGAFDYSPEVEVAIELVATHRISSIYPNPFNPQARFTVTVQQTQMTRVAVFDVLGREMVVLHEGSLEAGTAHAFVVPGQAWSSGLYYIVVQGTQFREARQVMLVK